MREISPTQASTTPDKDVASISLLPLSLIELCGVLGCPFVSVPLPQSIEVGSNHISLAALNLRQVGDLGAVSPITLLTLMEISRGFDEDAGEIWPQALAAASSIIAPVLESVMARALSIMFVLPFTADSTQSWKQEPAYHDLDSQSSYSALFIEPSDVLKALGYESPVDCSTVLRMPSGMSAMAMDGCSPDYVPLLSLAVRHALEAAGCDLTARLDTLPLNIRTLNTCIRSGDRRIADLVSHTLEQLFSRRNFGPKSYVNIVSALRTYLAPWFDNLTIGLILGGEDSAEPQAPVVSAEAEPEQPLESALASPVNPFAALRDSDLAAALDLYGVSWRDLPVGSLAPKSAGKPLAEIANDDSVAPPTHPATSSPLDEANDMLCELIQLPAACGLSPAFADLSAGALIDDGNSATADIVARTPANRADHILHEMVVSLTGLLLRHALRLDAFREVQDRALTTLRYVTIADLLTELMGAPNHKGAQLKHSLVDILYARQGLYNGILQTLEELGVHFGVTRERIRQIEKKALDHLGTPQMQPLTQALGRLVELAVRALGGVATLADVAVRLEAWIPFGNIHPEATTRFFAEWCQDVTLAADYLFARPLTEALIHQAQKVIRTIVLQQPGIAHDDLIVQALKSGDEQITIAGVGFVEAVLRTLTDIEEQEGHYHPVGHGALKSRIVHAMHSLGQPAKVAEISVEYRRLYPEESYRTDNSIRAFFDRFHDTFVCVGLSTYALVEWGYDPQINTIAALVERMLGQSDRPLRREEVVARAREKYHWKVQSISAQLDTNRRIRRFSNGFFGLRNHRYASVETANATHDDDNDNVGGGQQSGTIRPARERLVIGTYMNRRGNAVVQVRLSARCLGGYIPLTSQPLRDVLPALGKFRTEVWPATATGRHLIISRTSHDISGFSSLLSATRAHAGDALFIERLAATSADADDDAPMYRTALAHADDLIEAMDVVGLDADDSGATVGAMPVLHYTYKPHRLIRLIEHAVEHPWMPLTDVNEAMNWLPGNPAGREYLQLAQVTGLVAIGRPDPDGATVLRPTALGRKWAFALGGDWIDGRDLALSLPTYRAHVRSLNGIPLGDDLAGRETQRLRKKVLDTWDRVCGVTPGASSARVLEQSAAVLSTNSLTGPALPLLLLLLMAQSQGRGLSLLALDAPFGGQARAALRRLHALGLAIAEDDSNRIALAEWVYVAVASPDSIAETLRTSVGDERIATALAQAWGAALRVAGYRRTLRASDLYGELHALAPDAIYGALTSPPATTPEYALDADMRLPFCAFPTLVADWALTDVADGSSDMNGYQTVISYATRSGDPTVDAPVGVALCDDLLGQPWDVERHLAGNAHLALLTLIAADEEQLAERLYRSEDGWRLAGDALVPALDTLVRALGYDVWDERYRKDPDQQTRLGDALVALAERLNIVVVDGRRLEAVNGVATRMYYEACDQGFIQQLTETFNASYASS